MSIVPSDSVNRTLVVDLECAGIQVLVVDEVEDVAASRTFTNP
jgi:hypothetical protein